MTVWYRLTQILLSLSLFCSCVLMFFAIYTPVTENQSKLLLPQHNLPKTQVPKKQLPEKQSPYYTKVEVEAYPWYSLPYNHTLQGQAFPFSDAQLRQFRLDVVHTLTQVPDDVGDRLVLVTAASSGFYSGTQAVIAGVQKYFPKHTLLVYDLGGAAGGLQKMVHDQIKGTPCRVQFRTFNFTNYPNHVKRLKTYAWKFLIIKEVLETHDALFWMDSSIKLKKTLPRSLHFHSSPLKLMAYSGHSNYAVTHPGMYTFLPTDKEKQKKTLQYDANSMLIVNTKSAFESVLQWVYLCSLHKECIAPSGSSTACSFSRGDPFTSHSGGCHRFDQAAANLLLANSLNFDYPSYVFNNGDYGIFAVMRGQGASGIIKTCGG